MLNHAPNLRPSAAALFEFDKNIELTVNLELKIDSNSPNGIPEIIQIEHRIENANGRRNSNGNGNA